MASLTRKELYDLVWDQPMATLAKEFGLSDVALHKTCRKHDIPTPPPGYWAKKMHGKPVTQTPLPKVNSHSQRDIVIHEGFGSIESQAAKVARTRVREAIGQQDSATAIQIDDPIVKRTNERFAKAKADKSGIARVDGKNVITVAQALGVPLPHWPMRVMGAVGNLTAHSGSQQNVNPALARLLSALPPGCRYALC